MPDFGAKMRGFAEPKKDSSPFAWHGTSQTRETFRPNLLRREFSSGCHHCWIQSSGAALKVGVGCIARLAPELAQCPP